MRRIRLSYLFVIIIVIAIVGISIVIPEVYFSESYSGIIEEQDWTPLPTETPTQIIAATLTLTPHVNPARTVSAPSSINTGCVYPSEYWEEHPELWLEMLVGNTMYSQEDIGLIFDDSSQEIHNILIEQLYLANLNIFTGADSTNIDDALNRANLWLQTHVPEVFLPDEDLLIGIQLAQTLYEYNTARKGPQFCTPYESLTVVPEAIEIAPTSTAIKPTATSTLTPSSTATRVVVTQRPTTASTKTKKPDNNPDPDPTDPPRPTQEPDTPVPPPPPTDPPPPPPTDPPPTDPPPPTSAPPEDTPKPTSPPKPTDSDDKSTPTPAP